MRPGVRLAIDVGSVRVGVAKSDPSGLIASAFQTLQRDETNGSDLSTICRIARDHSVVEVVVGLPLSLDGSKGRAARVAHDYAVALARDLAGVTVRLVDERLSTVAAHQQLRTAGVRGRAQRGVVDQVAAVVVLQSALDAERASGRPPGAVVAPGEQAEGPSAPAREARGR